KATKKPFKMPSFKLSNQQKLVLGSFLALFGVLLFIAFVSFFFNGHEDQSILSDFVSRDKKAKNWLSKSGAWLSDFFIHRGFGISSFIFSGLIFLSGLYVLMDLEKSKLRKHWFWGLVVIFWLSTFFGFFVTLYDDLGGAIGYEVNTYLLDYIGIIGTVLLLLFALITYLAMRFKLTFQNVTNAFSFAKKDINDEFSNDEDNEFPIAFDNNLSAEAEDIKSAFEIALNNDAVIP